MSAEIGRKDYAERREARIERLETRAAKASRESTSRLESARRGIEMIPPGQPILVGHHSERGHRRALEKHDVNMRKGIEAGKRAEALARRAKFAEANTAISADDPEALERLRVKRAACVAIVERMKRVNKALAPLRKHGAEKIESVRAALVAAGEPEALIEKALSPRTWAWGMPDSPDAFKHAKFSTTNDAAEIRRIDKRIKVLTELAETRPEEDQTFGEITVREEDNRVQIVFPSKPDDATRKVLKSHGFRWAPSTGAWQRLTSNAARYHARRIAAELSGQVAP